MTLVVTLFGCVDSPPGSAPVGPLNVDDAATVPVPEVPSAGPAPEGALEDVDAPVGNRPVQGGGLLLLSDGERGVALDPGSDELAVFEIEVPQVRFVVDLGENAWPFRMVEDDVGNVFVTLRRSGQIAAVDPSTGALWGRRTVCAEPRGIAWHAATGRLKVACQGGELLTVRPSDLEVESRVGVGSDLRDVAVTDDGTVWVSEWRSARIHALDADNVLLVSQVPPTFTTDMVDFFVSETFVFEPEVAWDLETEGNRVWMLHQRGDRPTDGTPPPEVPQVYYSTALCGGIVHGAVTRFELYEEPATSTVLGDTVLPVDLEMTSAGDFYVANAGVVDIPPVDGPIRSFVQTTTMSMFSSCSFGYDIPLDRGYGAPVAVALHEDVLVALTQQPTQLIIGDVKVPWGAPADDQVLAFRLFHQDAGGGMACASCHPEAQDDGAVWHLDDPNGRKTQNLASGIADTAPYHWDGVFPTLDGLMQDVFENRMLGHEVSASDSAAFQVWVDQVLPIRDPRPAADAVARGEALFHDPVVACVDCHSGSRWTNNDTVDVGTGLALQVPSLVGVSGHPPFLHDGCAASLRDRFDPACGGGDRHGVTSHLSDAELDDLVAFLTTL